ncbi:MAG: hypothetical protein KKH61_20600 [Gammaproteobacteria bacterium]|nr:hypothetical protein [Gammaproteobacteria bacterium]
MATDYKEWIAERAEELAQERYNKSYDSIPDDIKEELFARAEADYSNREAARIDAAYDAYLERQIYEADSGDNH